MDVSRKAGCSVQQIRNWRPQGCWPVSQPLVARVDAAHAQLHRERRDLAETREAVRHITTEPIAGVEVSANDYH